MGGLRVVNSERFTKLWSYMLGLAADHALHIIWGPLASLWALVRQKFYTLQLF